jgi:hypothetical protein
LGSERGVPRAYPQIELIPWKKSAFQRLRAFKFSAQVLGKKCLSIFGIYGYALKIRRLGARIKALFFMP